MAWMDGFWDDDVGLLWNVKRTHHLVRESSLYALGLVQRGDVELAQRALLNVAAHQFDAPGWPFDGTFRRSPEEGDPPDDAMMWLHYDPNWRQFIGTTFALIIDQHGDALDPGTISALRGSIERAVATEPDDRVSPAYANIALMKSSLDAWAGREEQAVGFARQVAAHFDEHSTFLEYNSPTYYGIDLYALALWRRSHVAEIAELGSRIEATLWRDIARFYHAGMRNMCGPFDRCYGIDMTAHATPLGLYIWALVGAEAAPFPDPATRFRHPHDICFGPAITAMPTRAPDDVMPDLVSFGGERTIEQTVTTFPERVVTAWLADDVMLGGWSGPTSGIGLFQHAHATMHQRLEDGSIGWLRLRPESAAEATVTPGTIRITGTDERSAFEASPADRLDAFIDRFVSM
jgi:hypothetical protein